MLAVSAALLLAACGGGDTAAPTTGAAPECGCRVEGAEPLGKVDRLPGSCRVEMFDGGVRSLREIRDGKQLVLNFWATWYGTVAHRQFGPLTAEELRRAIHARLEE